MFNHVLVPIDRKRDPGRALEVALRLAAGGRVTLLHVVELIADTDREELWEFYDALEARSKADLYAVAKELEGAQTAASVTVDTRVVFGKRVQEIVRFAEREGVGLIVLPSHPIDPADPTKNWGTISYRVAIVAACPVMLVK